MLPFTWPRLSSEERVEQLLLSVQLSLVSSSCFSDKTSQINFTYFNLLLDLACKQHIHLDIEKNKNKNTNVHLDPSLVSA